METGVGINPVTLRPKTFRVGQDRDEKKAIEKKRLQEKAADLALLHSDEATRFKDLILGRMEKRIEALIRSDPEATAYYNLIVDWGHKVNAAAAATEKLYREHFQKTDERSFK